MAHHRRAVSINFKKQPHSIPLLIKSSNSLFCAAIIIAYVSQYIAIGRTSRVMVSSTVVSSAVAGISSHYILHHALLSMATLCIRIANDLYYDTFNCANNGTLRGHQATSALTGYIQVGVQWACALAL